MLPKKSKMYVKSVQGMYMKGRFESLKQFNWRLFISLCALALIPAIYQTIRTFLISFNSMDGVFDVIGQMEWFDLINETLQAFLIIPLYSILNKIFKNDSEKFARYAFKTGLLAFMIYTLFSIGVLIYGAWLLKVMNPDGIDVVATSVYLQLETIAFMIGIIISFVNVVFVVIGKDKNVYIFLAIQTVLSLIVDFTLIPACGVYGIAISNIIVNVILAVSSFSLLYVQKQIQFCWFQKSDLSVAKEWGKVGVFSGLQQFIDNAVTYRLKEGSTLPAGLTLTEAGYIAGKPTQTVTDHKFTVEAVSKYSETQEAEYSISVAIKFGGNTQLPEAAAGEEYNTRIDTVQGADNVKYTLKQGSVLPEGLTLAEDGRLSGTPTQAGVYQVTFVADAGENGSDEITLTLYVAGTTGGFDLTQATEILSTPEGIGAAAGGVGLLGVIVFISKKKGKKKGK